MRGLKQLIEKKESAKQTSHPLRMRGLKRSTKGMCADSLCVASFTDAWIETDNHKKKRGKSLVASFTDAWIETGRK